MWELLLLCGVGIMSSYSRLYKGSDPKEETLPVYSIRYFGGQVKAEIVKKM